MSHATSLDLTPVSYATPICSVFPTVQPQHRVAGCELSLRYTAPSPRPAAVVDGGA